MANRRSIRHHYIPKVIQKSFSTEHGGSKIWYSSRKDGYGKYSPPELRNISSTFQERNLYTTFGENGPSDVIERKFYGPLDSALGILIPKLLSQLSHGIVPDFSSDALNDIRAIMFDIIKRTPDFTRSYSEEDVARAGIEDILKTDSHNFTELDVEGMKLSLEDSAYLKTIGRDAVSRARIKPLSKVSEALSQFSIKWAAINGKHSFALPSMGGYRIGNGDHNGLANEKVEIWMPISPKFCMVMVRDPYMKIPLLNYISESKTREINEYAIKNGRAIAAHSRPLIESLTGMKAKI